MPRLHLTLFRRSAHAFPLTLDEVLSPPFRENTMSGNGHLSPAQIHAKLKHPIVDGDGHWVEFPPVFAEKMRKVGGDKAADGFLAPRGAGEGLKMTPAERTERRIAQPNFWNRQGANTLDRDTAMMPKLLYERLDEI